jgi:2'-5' RNA ligase
MRLFVAVDPPAGAVPGVRNPHVTLRFLGDIDDDVVDEVAAALRAGLAGVEPCEAELGTRARRLGRGAVVVPVSGLEDLAAAVDRAVGRFGGQDRPFVGHLTLGRGRKATDVVSVPTTAVRWRVGEVALLRSELGKGDGGSARHTVVAVVALDGLGG